jgi:hypothetical protein
MITYFFFLLPYKCNQALGTTTMVTYFFASLDRLLELTGVIGFRSHSLNRNPLRISHIVEAVTLHHPNTCDKRRKNVRSEYPCACSLTYTASTISRHLHCYVQYTNHQIIGAFLLAAHHPAAQTPSVEPAVPSMALTPLHTQAYVHQHQSKLPARDASTAHEPTGSAATHQ